MTEGGRRPLFDPTGMMQLFVDVQRLGFETAANVASRFSATAARDLGPDAKQASGDSPSSDSAGSDFGATAEAAVDAYFDLLQASFEVFGSYVRASMEVFRGAAGQDVVHLGEAGPGRRATGEVFIHNGSGAEADVKVFTTDIVGAGTTISWDTVTLVPQEMTIARGETQRIAVSVPVPEEAEAGKYSGVLTATTDPVNEVVITFTVREK